MVDLFALESPRLSLAEIELFKETLRNSRAYFEFGMGGSTVLAVRAGIPAIVTVDSDPEWVAAVRKQPEVAKWIEVGRLTALHADIGPVREWGNPASRDEITRWHTYLSAGWAEWDRRGDFPEIVFVDGRFRVACCYSLVVAAGGRIQASAPKVLLHDFNDERPHYRDVLEFFEIERLVNSLCLLRMRSSAPPVTALVKLLDRQFDYG